jgi:hypothetical protein
MAKQNWHLTQPRQCRSSFVFMKENSLTLSEWSVCSAVLQIWQSEGGQSDMESILW